METVEVVIRIPKEYKDYIEGGAGIIPDKIIQYLFNALDNGIVLPKGHGDLKDMNDLCYKSRYGCKGNCDYLHTCDLYGAPTIIETDKET